MTDDKSYEDLGAAIITQATVDYRSRLKNLKKKRVELKAAEAAVKSLENFFNSEWFGKLSGGFVDPGYIMKQIQMEEGLYETDK